MDHFVRYRVTLHQTFQNFHMPASTVTRREPLLAGLCLFACTIVWGIQTLLLRPTNKKKAQTKQKGGIRLENVLQLDLELGTINTESELITFHEALVNERTSILACAAFLWYCGFFINAAVLYLQKNTHKRLIKKKTQK